jgi:hypothetical protein
MRVLSALFAAAVWLPATPSASESMDSREKLIETKLALVSAAQTVRSARLEWEAAHEQFLNAQLSVEVAELNLETPGRLTQVTSHTLSSAKEDWTRALKSLEARASRLGRAEHLLKAAEDALNRTQLAQSSTAQ